MSGAWGIVNPVHYNKSHTHNHEDYAKYEKNKSLQLENEILLIKQVTEQTGVHRLSHWNHIYLTPRAWVSVILHELRESKLVLCEFQSKKARLYKTRAEKAPLCYYEK